MQRSEITEFHYIAPIANVPSILKLGILSHNRAALVPHESVAWPVVQARRAPKSVDGRPLHDFANVYFTGRNPMMSKVRDKHHELCVLRISQDILDPSGAVITDRNAASDYVKFFVSPGGLAAIDYDRVFADYWTHPEDQFEEWKHKSEKCSEVLVPGRIGPEHILGACVSGLNGLIALNAVAPDLDVRLVPTLFFQ